MLVNNQLKLHIWICRPDRFMNVNILGHFAARSRLAGTTLDERSSTRPPSNFEKRLPTCSFTETEMVSCWLTWMEVFCSARKSIEKVANWVKPSFFLYLGKSVIVADKSHSCSTYLVCCTLGILGRGCCYFAPHVCKINKWTAFQSKIDKLDNRRQAMAMDEVINGVSIRLVREDLFLFGTYHCTSGN